MTEQVDAAEVKKFNRYSYPPLKKKLGNFTLKV